MKIKKWSGRLGNAIQQITNCMYYCERHDLNFESPSFGYIDGKSVGGVRYNGEAEIIKPITISNRQKCNGEGIFFFHKNGSRKKQFHVDNIDELENKRRHYCMKYILPNTCFNKEINPLDDNHLVIHIRAGDIIRFNNPNKKGHIYHSYKLNPISYYEHLIPKFEKITIVTSTVNNFITERLLEKYKHIKIQSGSLTDDFTTLLSAKNLTSSGVGTFAFAAALLSKNLKTYYHTNLHLHEHMSHDSLHHVDTRCINISDEYRKNGWRNSADDREQILNFQDITIAY